MGKPWWEAPSLFEVTIPAGFNLGSFYGVAKIHCSPKGSKAENQYAVEGAFGVLQMYSLIGSPQYLRLSMPFWLPCQTAFPSATDKVDMLNSLCPKLQLTPVKPPERKRSPRILCVHAKYSIC